MEAMSYAEYQLRGNAIRKVLYAEDTPRPMTLIYRAYGCRYVVISSQVSEAR